MNGVRPGLWIWRLGELRYGGAHGVEAALRLAARVEAGRLIVKVLDGTRPAISAQTLELLVRRAPADLQVCAWAWPYPRPPRERGAPLSYPREQAQILARRYAPIVDGRIAVDIEAPWSASLRLLRTPEERREGWSRSRWRRWRWEAANRALWRSQDGVAHALRLRAAAYLAALEAGPTPIHLDLCTFPRPDWHAIDWTPWLRAAERVVVQVYYPRGRGPLRDRWARKLVDAESAWERELAAAGLDRPIPLRWLGPAYRGRRHAEAFLAAHEVTWPATTIPVERGVDWWAADHLARDADLLAFFDGYNSSGLDLGSGQIPPSTSPSVTIDT